MSGQQQIELPKVTPHPLVPWFSDEEVQAMLLQPDGAAAIAEFAAEREEMILKINADAYHEGFEFPHWHDADKLAHEKQLAYASGGKRASKSWWAAKRVMQAAVLYPGTKIWCFQGSDTTSITEQQGLLWHYMPPNLRALNNKRHPVYKISHSEANGFSAAPRNKFILPNRSQVHFLTYNQNPQEYQGWKLGCPSHLVDRIQAKLREENIERYKADDSKRPWGELSEAEQWLIQWRGVPPNVGAWPDEKLTLIWLQTLKQRCSDHSAKVLWTFSTMEGLTDTMKEVIGEARTIESRPAELLSDRVNVQDCPRGHMPYIQQPSDPNMGVIYFFSEFNPLGNYGGKGGVKSLCEGKDSRYVEMHAYGYARDTGMRACPNFGPCNIIDDEHVPKEGTRYTITDPAGKRNWATIWVLVTPGAVPEYFIYRDWPDAQTYGEWALPDDGGASGQKTKYDGKPGPAQRSLGYGFGKYKWMLLEKEGAGEKKGEEIAMRFMDPRAASAPQIESQGGTTMAMQLAQEDEIFVNGERVKVPGMQFIPVPCKKGAFGEETEGLSQLNDLLDWDPEQPMVQGMNSPRLWVAKSCRQVIWALSNYTGMDGSKAACKDFVDPVRYAAQAQLMHITEQMREGQWGGSY